MEQKQKKEKALSITGCHVFDGNLTLRIGKKEIKVRCEYFGLDLKHASQEHQMVVLIKQHLPYNELDTGWLVRTKQMDADHKFGLKPTKNSRSWSVYDYNDVVAWGYADGGLNSDHFNSCRMRPEDWPQFAGESHNEDVDVDFEEVEVERRCVKLRYQDGEIHYNAIQGADEPTERGGTKLMHDCAKVFYDFRKEHPEVTEMHFYTDDLMNMNEEDDDEIPEEELTEDEKRIKRMAEEYDQLAGRLHRLQAFRDTDTYKQLPEGSRYLLDKQCKAMDDYESTLKQRIQLECDTANKKE